MQDAIPLTRMKVLTIYRLGTSKRTLLEVRVLAGKPLPGQVVSSEETGTLWRIGGTSETTFYDPYTARQKMEERMKQGFWEVVLHPLSEEALLVEGEHLRTA